MFVLSVLFVLICFVLFVCLFGEMLEKNEQYLLECIELKSQRDHEIPRT